MGAQCLADALQTNTLLRELNLRYNQIGADGALYLSAALKGNIGLEHLNLEANRVGVSGARSLSEMLLVNKTIRELLLRRNDIGVEGAKYLSSSLRMNTTLQKLDLDTNNIGDAGAAAIACAISKPTVQNSANHSLVRLELGGNGIGKHGQQKLWHALQENQAVQEVNLTHNRLNTVQMNLMKPWAKKTGQASAARRRLNEASAGNSSGDEQDNARGKHDYSKNFASTTPSTTLPSTRPSKYGQARRGQNQGRPRSPARMLAQWRRNFGGHVDPGFSNVF